MGQQKDSTEEINKLPKSISATWSLSDKYLNGIDPVETSNGIKETEGKLDFEFDWYFITEMAERMSKNKHKYPAYNWKKPMEIEKLKQALLRHTVAVMKDEYEDDGQELGHLLAIACDSMMLYHQKKNYGK